MAEPDAGEKTGPKPMDPIDLDYFAELRPRKMAFGYDACKALVLLLGEKVENSISAAAAGREAKRCLRCDYGRNLGFK